MYVFLFLIEWQSKVLLFTTFLKGCFVDWHRFFHNLPHLCSTRGSTGLHTTPSSCWTNRGRLFDWNRRTSTTTATTATTTATTTTTISSQNVSWTVAKAAAALPSCDCLFVDQAVCKSLTSLHSSLPPGKIVVLFYLLGY